MARRTLSPILVLATLLFGWHLSLALACNELPRLWRARRGAGTEVLVDVLAIGVYLLLAVVPLRLHARPRLQRALAIPLWGLLAVGLFARAIDWAIYRYSGAHLNVLVLTHVQGTVLELVRGLVPITCIIVGVIAAVGMPVLLVRAARRGDRATLALPIAIVVTLVTLVPLFSGRLRRPRGEHATTNPEWALSRSVGTWAHEKRCQERGDCTVLLRETTRRKLLRFGLHVAPREAMPLYRANVYTQPHGLPHTPAFVVRPNVIVIFFESLSAEFLGAYRPARAGVTPNLDRFAKSAMRVSGYYNATTPTVVSLLSTLCSIYPPTGHEEFGSAYFGAVLCLSDVLAQRGWQPIFVRGIEASYANVGPFLHSQHFEVRDRADLGRALGEPPQSWGYSDPQLFRYVRQLLETRVDDRPLLLGLTTVDLHAPYPIREVPQLYDQSGGVLLDVVHATDAAFGEFWTWFEGSPYAKNTIVVVTGDHAIFPHPEYVQLRAPGWEKTYYDELPLMIYDPRLTLPKELAFDAASSVDLTPTLLHLLDIDQPNPFEGRSLFDDRSGYVGVLGEQAGLLWTNQPDEHGQRLIRNFGLSDCDPSNEDASGVLLSTCEQIEWHRWKSTLVQQRRIWRPQVQY